jgi:hypothetical protein
MTQPTKFPYKAPLPITDPGDPRRRQPAQTLERAQAIIWAMRHLFAKETLAFKALRLAYEAARVAYYAILDETDGDHLPDVREALFQAQRHLEEASRD